LFDLLRKDRSEGQAGAKPAPVIRRTPAPAAPPRPIEAPRPVEAARPERARVSPKLYSGEFPAPFLLRQVSVPVSWLLIGVIAVGCLLVIAFVVGQGYGPERLPNVPKDPTMRKLLEGPVTPGLVPKGPSLPGGVPAGAHPGGAKDAPKAASAERPSAPPPAAPRPTVAEKAAPPAAVRPGSAEKPAMTETPGAPQFRVRIAQLAVSQPDAIDKMRGFLLQKDIETDLETSRGFYVLYSRDRLADKKKADELAAKINKQLEAFEKTTKIPTSKTAYVTQTTKE
jgi:hypothetical protein